MQGVIIAVFLFGLLLTGVLGTETRLLFFWPGAVVLGLAGLLATLQWRLRVLFPPSDLCLLSALACTGYLAVRGLMSPVAVYAREDLYVLAGCWVVYVLTLTAASHPRWRLALLLTLLALVVGNLVVGFIHFTGQWDFHVVPNFARAATVGRIGGFFVNQNHLAAFFSMVLFLAAGWLGFGRGGAVLKLLLGFVVVATGIGGTLTVSRGALVGVAVGMAVFFLLSLWVVWQTQRHLFWSLLIGGLMLAALGGSVLWKVNGEYLKKREHGSPMANDERLMIWEAALAQHATSPVVGAGARMFYDGSLQYRSLKLPSYAEEALFAHNEYLQMLADYGWVGLGLVLLVVLAHGLNGLRFLHWFTHHKFLQTGRVTSTNLALCLGALGALVATLVHAAFEFHFHVAATAVTGALLLGLLANPGFEGDTHRTMKIPGVRLLVKLGLTAAALAMLVGAWSHGRGDYHLAMAQLAEARKDGALQMQELDQAAAADDQNGEVLYQRALARLNRLTDADRSAESPALKACAEDLERAVALNAHHYFYPLALADVYDAMGRYEEALTQIQRALVLAPLHEEPRLALGIHWHRLGEFDKAEAAYLWARVAPASNEEGTNRWFESYQVMLQHVAQMRGQPR